VHEEKNKIGAKMAAVYFLKNRIIGFTDSVGFIERFVMNLRGEAGDYAVKRRHNPRLD